MVPTPDTSATRETDDEVLNRFNALRDTDPAIHKIKIAVLNRVNDVLKGRVKYHEVDRSIASKVFWNDVEDGSVRISAERKINEIQRAVEHVIAIRSDIKSNIIRAIEGGLPKVVPAVTEPLKTDDKEKEDDTDKDVDADGKKAVGSEGGIVDPPKDVPKIKKRLLPTLEQFSDVAEKGWLSWVNPSAYLQSFFERMK